MHLISYLDKILPPRLRLGCLATDVLVANADDKARREKSLAGFHLQASA